MLRRLLALAVGVLTLCWGPLAAAAITVTNIGQGNSQVAVAAAPAVVISNVTASAGVPIILVLVTDTAAFGTFTCGDDGANGLASYTKASQYNGTNAGKVLFFYITNPAGLSAANIKCSWSGSAKFDAAAIQVTGLDPTNPLDLAPTTGVGGTGNSVAGLSTGTLNHAVEIVIGSTTVTAAPGTFTEAGGFTPITTSGSGFETHWGYQVVSSTASVAYAPSWVTSRSNNANVVTFFGPGGGAAVTPRGPLMGILP